MPGIQKAWKMNKGATALLNHLEQKTAEIIVVEITKGKDCSVVGKNAAGEAFADKLAVCSLEGDARRTALSVVFDEAQNEIGYKVHRLPSGPDRERVILIPQNVLSATVN